MWNSHEYSLRHMRNPFAGQQGIATIVGILFAVLSIAVLAFNPETDIVRHVSGVLIFASLVVLFIPKYRPWGKGLLLGSFGTLIIIFAFSLLISIGIVALKPS